MQNQQSRYSDRYCFLMVEQGYKSLVQSFREFSYLKNKIIFVELFPALCYLDGKKYNARHNYWVIKREFKPFKHEVIHKKIKPEQQHEHAQEFCSFAAERLLLYCKKKAGMAYFGIFCDIH